MSRRILMEEQLKTRVSIFKIVGEKKTPRGILCDAISHTKPHIFIKGCPEKHLQEIVDYLHAEDFSEIEKAANF
jgi:hypothetical protein